MDRLTEFKTFAVRELMLEYSKADAELHLLCCEDVGRYPTRFLVKDGIIATIKDGSDMMPWAIY